MINVYKVQTQENVHIGYTVIFLVYDSNVYAVVCSLFTRFTAYTFLATIN